MKNIKIKHITLFALLYLPTILISQVPSNYYNSANGLSGYALKTELKNIINTNFNSLSYSYLYTVYQTADADFYYENDATVLDMYSENPSGADAYSYAQIVANRCTGSSLYLAEAECYNREHIVPQIAFNYQFPMKSDAHFVFPTDGFVNAERGSYAFGEVSNPTWTSNNGSKVGKNTFDSYIYSAFEPIDEFKGDIARMMMYMYLRYGNQCKPNNVGIGSTASTPDDMIDLFLEWNAEDPVSDFERQRNTYHDSNQTYAQGNRNPFIDNAYLATKIWGGTPAEDSWGIYVSPDTEAPTVPANILINNTTLSSISVSWSASIDNVIVEKYEVYANGVTNGETTNTSYTLSTKGTSLLFKAKVP